MLAATTFLNPDLAIGRTMKHEAGDHSQVLALRRTAFERMRAAQCLFKTSENSWCRVASIIACAPVREGVVVVSLIFNHLLHSLGQKVSGMFLGGSWRRSDVPRSEGPPSQ